MNSFPPFSKKILIAAAFATFALLSGTNISARNNDNIRPDRKTLYKKGFYSSTLLTEPPERGNDAKWMEEGYKVLSLIRLDIPNPEGVIDEYREKFKESPLIPQMLFECAIAHFDREEYSEAAKLFSSIPVKDLYKGQRDEFYFRKGYCQMRMGNNGEAGSDFAEITACRYDFGDGFRHRIDCAVIGAPNCNVGIEAERENRTRSGVARN